MKTGKVIFGALTAMVLVVGLFLVNKIWIAPALARQAQARGVAAAGNHPVAPDFTLTTIGGDKISLGQFKGKVLVVDFWATWCGPCRIEIPGFVALKNRYRDQGLEIIGISEDEGSDAVNEVKDFYSRFKMNYPVGLAEGSVDQLYGGILGLPTTFLIGRDGRIYAKHTGTTDIAVFEEEIKTLLAAQPGSEISDFKPARQSSADDIEVKTPEEVKAENNPDVPGVNLTGLSAAQVAKLKLVLDKKPCTCGCNMTGLECRHKDPGCGVSRQMAQDEKNKLTKKSL